MDAPFQCGPGNQGAGASPSAVLRAFLQEKISDAILLKHHRNGCQLTQNGTLPDPVILPIGIIFAFYVCKHRLFRVLSTHENFVALLLKKGGNYLMKSIHIILVKTVAMGKHYLDPRTNLWNESL
jgi:hypothetical protein